MKKIIVITGPTGVGKTKLSLEIAKIFNGEIINADSMQVYKKLNIGTAKIKENDKEGVYHHLIDIKEVTDDYNVYDYQKDGRKIIDEIINRGNVPIIVGGTGLYIKALLYDYQFRDELIKKEYDEYSNDELYKMLIAIDPNSKVHPHNRRRIIRMLNFYANNEAKNNNGNKLLYDVIFIGLTTERSILYKRIDDRVDEMIEEGLLEEVRELYDNNIRSKAVMTGIGYKELYCYFDGDISLDEAIRLIKQNSRHYAKRQYTWFKHQMDIEWFNVDFKCFSNTISKVVEYIEKAYNL